MRILIVGAEGTVGSAIARELGARHEIVKAGRNSGELHVDIADRASIEALYEKAGKIDAVVSAAGTVHFGPLATMTEEQFMVGLRSKVMGQVNLVLAGLAQVSEGGSFTLVSGVLNHDPIVSGAAAAAANAALEGFVKGASIEMPRRLRINLVSPGLLEESVPKYGAYFPGHIPVPGARVAKAFQKCVEGAINGEVVKVF